MAADVLISEGSAQAFLDHDHLDRNPLDHDRPPARPVVAVHRVQRPTLVLGSTQPTDLIVDAAAPTREGWEVARRRSGGGLVVLLPGDGVWVDVFVPASHPRWDPDVNEAFHWLGHVFAAALTPALHRASTAPPIVHTGPLAGGAAGRLYCFAGVGPGEVIVPGPGGIPRKLVGISQRRNRAGARFQCLVALRHEPAPAVALITDRYRSAMEQAMQATIAGWPPGDALPTPGELESMIVDALSRAL